MSRFFIFLLALYGLSSCSKPEPPRYVGYENFRLEKAGVERSILASDVKLYNPNGYNLQLKSASMDVFFNDRFLGHSTVDSPITLVARDTTTFPLRMEAKAKDLLAGGARLFMNPDVRIRITGNAKAGRSGVYINVPINYEGVQRIDVRELIGHYNRLLESGQARP